MTLANERPVTVSAPQFLARAAGWAKERRRRRYVAAVKRRLRRYDPPPRLDDEELGRTTPRS
ncbi:hypothetical protein [Cryptosporangium phraense]|uniref:Uncharacterized protein n=1 Tax=Cryptosporangium phraense TaxID=2593070 RepID=A0A545AZ81_9ACTN|nr:hypothetical protein [Cryptosporangium phraense]TQS46588.1 hypothetical protein FL583_04200 [Cryptosporangium phraense]